MVQGDLEESLRDIFEEGPESDERLVQRVLAADDRAFEEFFERMAPGLFRFALARMGNQADAAEEVVQATLSQALRKLHTFRSEAALFTWVCAICRREISAYWRRRKRTAREVGLGGDLAVQAALESLAREQQTVAGQRADLVARVQAALDILPPRYGDALEWKYLEEVPVEEVGRRLGLGLKAAESLLTRAREAFRRAFAAVGGPPEKTPGPLRPA
jgi:RNA polymerase sigma-70 factor (ECF subfamily)